VNIPASFTKIAQAIHKTWQQDLSRWMDE